MSAIAKINDQGMPIIHETQGGGNYCSYCKICHVRAPKDHGPTCPHQLKALLAQAETSLVRGGLHDDAYALGLSDELSVKGTNK